MQIITSDAFDVLSGKKDPADFSFVQLEEIHRFLMEHSTEWASVRTSILELMEKKAETFGEKVAFASVSQRSMSDLSSRFMETLKDAKNTAELIRLFFVKNRKDQHMSPLPLHLKIFKEVSDRGIAAYANPSGYDNGFVESFFCSLNAAHVLPLSRLEVSKLVKQADAMVKSLHAYDFWKELFLFEKKEYPTALPRIVEGYDKISGGYIFQSLGTVTMKKKCVTFAGDLLQSTTAESSIAA